MMNKDHNKCGIYVIQQQHHLSSLNSNQFEPFNQCKLTGSHFENDAFLAVIFT